MNETAIKWYKYLQFPAEFDEEFYALLMERVATSRRKENVKTVVSDLSGTYNSGK